MHKIHWFTVRLGLVIALVIACGMANAQNADIKLLRTINGQRRKTADGIMAGISNSAEPISIAIPLVQLVYGYCWHKPQTVAAGWQAAAGLGITAIISTGLKYTVHRQRPYITYLGLNSYSTENTASFPSGHTSFAFCAATSLSIAYPRWYMVAPAYLWAASVGYSRLYLGEHYPTDVLAGAAIGTGSAWLAYKGNKWLQHRRAGRHKAK